MKKFIFLAFVVFGLSSAIFGQTVSPSPQPSPSPSPTGSVAAPSVTTYQFPNARQRFKRFVTNTIGPGALTGASFGAFFGTLGNEPPEWEKNGKGFGRRFASNIGQGAIRQLTEYGLSEALGQDQRYQKCACKGFGKRFGYALKSGFTARNRQGKEVFSAPKIISPLVGGVAAVKLWQPDRLTARDGLRRGAIGIMFGTGFNVIREFFFKK